MPVQMPFILKVLVLTGLLKCNQLQDAIYLYPLMPLWTAPAKRMHQIVHSSQLPIVVTSSLPNYIISHPQPDQLMMTALQTSIISWLYGIVLINKSYQGILFSFSPLCSRLFMFSSHHSLMCRPTCFSPTG